MPYINTEEMLMDTRESHNMVGAFNIVNHTSLISVIEAAKDKGSPLIVQTSQKTVIEPGYKI